VKYFNRFGVALAVALAPVFAFAGAGPYDAVTAAVDWDTAITALGVVAAAWLSPW
jgi:hypothetical protein